MLSISLRSSSVSVNRTVRWGGGGGGGPNTNGVVARDDDASDRDPADLGRWEAILPLR